MAIGKVSPCGSGSAIPSFVVFDGLHRRRYPWGTALPGVTPKDGVCGRPVDFLSIYPTLCDLAGIEVPKHVEGRSIKSLLVDPASEWNGAAVCTHGFKNHTVRTDKWRYIRYADGSEELYDHASDPFEWTNLADQDRYATVKMELAKLLPAKDAPKLDKAAE